MSILVIDICFTIFLLNDSFSSAALSDPLANIMISFPCLRDSVFTFNFHVCTKFKQLVYKDCWLKQFQN